MEKYIPFFQGEKRIITERLAEYFEKAGLETKIYYDESLDAYILSVPSDKENEARKLYQEFYFNERDRVEREEKNHDFLRNYDEANIVKRAPDDVPAFNLEEDSTGDLTAESGFVGEIKNDSLDETAAASENEDYSGKAENVVQTDNAGGSDYGSQAYYSDLPDNEELRDVSGQTGESGQSDDISGELDEAGQDDDADEEGTDKDDEKAALRRLLKGPGNYVFKSEKYKDYTSSLFIFLLVGICGMVFVALNVTQVLHILSGFIQNFVMGALFAFFIYEGILSGIKAKQIKAEVDEENQLTAKINEWLQNNVTKEFLDSIADDEESQELDYIKKTETIRDMLLKEFGDINTDYLDRLIDEYYNKNFD